MLPSGLRTPALRGINGVCKFLSTHEVNMSSPADSRTARRRARDARGNSDASSQIGEPAGGRLPGAPRERRPLLAVLAVLLIVGGALVAGLLAARLDQRTEMLVAAETLKAGHVIELTDLASTSVAASAGALIPAERAREVVGQTVRVEVTKGELLQSTQLDPAPAVKEGQTLVGLSLSVGRFPAGGVTPGDVVTLVNVKDATTAVVSAQVVEAFPASGNEKEWTSGAVISLLVPKAEASKVARLGAEESIALAVTATGHPIGDF